MRGSGVSIGLAVLLALASFSPLIAAFQWFGVNIATLRQLGKKTPVGEIKERIQSDKFASETFEDFVANLAANKVDIGVDQAVLGPWLSLNSDTLKFEGEFAEDANKLSEGSYREEFKLPTVG